jgi:hypothetical protein
VLQLPVFLLQRPQPLRLAHFHPAVLPLPPVQRLRRDPVLAAQLRRRHPSFGFFQDAYDLFFVESTLPHNSSSWPWAGHSKWEKSHFNWSNFRGAGQSPMAPYLLTNLPSERQTEGKPSEEIANDDVRRAVNRTIHMLKNATSETPRPIHTARLLYMILDNEKFLNIEKLNEALRPYWPILWRVCARGHYLRHGQPLTDSAFWGADSRLRNRGPLPSFQEGEYRLEFHRGPETEFSVWLHFPGRFALQYPLFDYPRIAELRTILERLELRDTLIFWEGRYFLASTWLDEEEKVGVEFRSRDNGIALTFHHDDWQAIKSLFRRCWQAPEVRRLWDALAREYGEL